jgi:hypothetical protein
LIISPANNSITVQHDSDNNTLTFRGVPDGEMLEITYRARVLGTGNINYSNTVIFGNYIKIIEESTTVTSSGGGSASIPSITIIKRDGENIYNLAVRY